jgi:hypothetical protein
MEARDEKVLTAEERSYLADAQRVMASPAYADRSHPKHLEAIRAARRLFVAAYGEPGEAQAENDRPLSSEERLWGVK